MGELLRMKLTIEHVFFTADQLQLQLSDGRALTLPFAQFPRLRDASPKDRDAWELCAGGAGIHWPTLDEDLSLNGLLRDGTPLPPLSMMANNQSNSSSL